MRQLTCRKRTAASRGCATLLSMRAVVELAVRKVPTCPFQKLLKLHVEAIDRRVNLLLPHVEAACGLDRRIVARVR